MQKFIFAICLLTTSIAGAEEPSVKTPRSYVEVNGLLGLSHPFIGVLMGAASGGYRLGDPWWLHGQLSSGFGADDEGSGYIGQARFGLEARPCVASGIACFVAGLDIGLEHATYTGPVDDTYIGEPAHHYTLTSFVAVPRVGLDVGGEHLRFRAAFELDFGLIEQKRYDSQMPENFAGELIGGNVVAGPAWQW